MSEEKGIGNMRVVDFLKSMDSKNKIKVYESKNSCRECGKLMEEYEDEDVHQIYCTDCGVWYNV